MVPLRLALAASLLTSAIAQRRTARRVRDIAEDPEADEALLRAELDRAARALEAHDYLCTVVAELVRDYPGSAA